MQVDIVSVLIHFNGIEFRPAVQEIARHTFTAFCNLGISIILENVNRIVSEWTEELSYVPQPLSVLDMP